jgi:hypothetical protein
MFPASSAHLQEGSDVNCICMQPLVSSFSAGGRLAQSLKGDSCNYVICKIVYQVGVNKRITHNKVQSHTTIQQTLLDCLSFAALRE